MSKITNEASGERRSGEGTLTNQVNDSGSTPSELYGTFTWKIRKFSQINEREIRSSDFKVGGHRWNLLIYPRGCDVSNHLSLFLCVANRDKLLPGWSHFAQITVSVVNKDLRKSKSSDTLHQFCKKEYDWGWKKFIELPSLQHGFIDEFDSLEFKAQVQVIRESMDRPFPCLNSQYRRELVSIYWKNVEEKFLTFVGEKRNKFLRLIDNKKRWTSLCTFWLGMNQNLRLEMSREKMDVILKPVVKHFFIKNEVTSTLVMDFLFYGFKSLNNEKMRIVERLAKLVAKEVLISNQVESALKTPEDETKKERTIDAKKFPAPIAYVDKDMFIVKDPMILLERFVLVPLPEIGSSNLVQLGNVGTRYNMELEENQLTDFGRWALEIFVLDHIFCNKIEFAYEEAIALKRQDELIHEEETKNKMLSQKKKNSSQQKLLGKKWYISTNHAVFHA